MVERWVAIIVLGSAWLSGCASAGLFSQGENAAYSFWNNSDEDVEKVEIAGIYQARKKYLISSSIAKAAGWNTRWFVGGSQYMSDTGHRVPEEVEVSWRKMPLPGGKPYMGEPMGPYHVKVRSRIPQEALKLASRDGYSLGIEFSVGKAPVLLCWGVVGDKSDKRGRSTIMAGGQCNPDDVAWRSDIDWRKPRVWFPEKP